MLLQCNDRRNVVIVSKILDVKQKRRPHSFTTHWSDTIKCAGSESVMLTSEGGSCNRWPGKLPQGKNASKESSVCPLQSEVWFSVGGTGGNLHISVVGLSACKPPKQIRNKGMRRRYSEGLQAAAGICLRSSTIARLDRQLLPYCAKGGRYRASEGDRYEDRAYPLFVAIPKDDANIHKISSRHF